MSNEFYSLVTDIGATKQLESIRDGVPFDVYEIALGDSNGNYYTPQTNQTALRNEVWRGLIERCEWSDNKFYCITTVPANVGGFTVREAGVFDSDNNLLVITKFPETTKQDPESGTVKQLTIRIELELSNSELAELVINPNIQLVTRDELTETLTDIENEYQKLEEKGQPLGYAPLDINNKIPLPFLPKIDTKSILTPFCLNSCRLDVKGNPDLLSCETVKVEKYTATGLGVFYTALNYQFERDGIVYADTELTIPKGTIVAVDTSTNYIAFGSIETLTEDATNPNHYSATNIGDFYIQNTLAVGVECFSDVACTNSIGYVTYLNLTRISIGQNETYTYNGHITTHI
ncbi:phage tail protein, partial [bacterium]|nr:phage tail protein [bacterium]